MHWWRMMRKRWNHLLASLLCLAGCLPAEREPLPPAGIQRWALYYDTKLPATAFAGLDLVVFDGRYHPDITPLKGKTILLAYVSIGEVHGDTPEKAMLERSKALLYRNSNWNSYAVNPASPKWRKIVFGQVNQAAEDGFDGVMLDTVDSPIEWARKVSPARHEATKQAAYRLVRDIRMKYPNMQIMLNRGADILPLAAPYLDYALAESILSQKDNSSGQFNLFPPNTYAEAVAQLQQKTARAEHLQLFTLDYWDVGDVKGLERIYAAQRASGFIPYVTSQDLRHYTPEPERNTDIAALQ